MGPPAKNEIGDKCSERFFMGIFFQTFFYHYCPFQNIPVLQDGLYCPLRGQFQRACYYQYRELFCCHPPTLNDDYKGRHSKKKYFFIGRTTKVLPSLMAQWSMPLFFFGGGVYERRKKLEVFCRLLSEDDHSHWAPPYWNIMRKKKSLG